MEFQIRECEAEDANAIFELNGNEMGYEYPLEKTRSKLESLLKSSCDKIFVATVQTKVVGYVHAANYDVIYSPHMKNIMGIAVMNGYKKKGIGKALLLAVESWAKETGAYGVRLSSGITRTNAHKFYHHCGYGGDKQQINLKKIF